MNPLHIRVGSQKAAANAVSQRVLFVPHSQKKQKLLDTLRSIPKPPVLIFCNTHFTVDSVVEFLRKEQFHVVGFHKEKPQTYRFSAIHAFKEGRLDVLVATGLAARGLDIVDVTHVIMYDIPDRIEDYIHRAGRTGRAGRVGAVTAFLTHECKIAQQLRELLQQSGEVCDIVLNVYCFPLVA
jgi:superfamily II DNA/RNA helicase